MWIKKSIPFRVRKKLIFFCHSWQIANLNWGCENFCLFYGDVFLAKFAPVLGSMSVIIEFSRLAMGRSVQGQLYSCCQYAKSWIEWRWHRFFHDIIKMQETFWSKLTHQMQTQTRKRYMKTEISNLITLCSVDSCHSTEVIPFAILILNQHHWYAGT